jgi:DUF917 family protein
VIFPDMACLLEPATGRGMMSTELVEGIPLILVGARCHGRLREVLHSEVDDFAFSPARSGYPKLDYQPIEDLAEGFK